MSAFLSNLMAQESDLLPLRSQEDADRPHSREASGAGMLSNGFLFNTGKTVSCQEHTGKNDNYGITNLKFSIKVLIFWG